RLCFYRSSIHQPHGTAARQDHRHQPARRSDLLLRARYSETYVIGLKDVRLVQTGLQPERVAALRQGLIVASILNRPNNLVLEQEGYRRLLDIEDLKLPAGVRCLITTRKLVKSRPALTENFVMSWLESVRFILNQKRETKQIIGKYTQNADDLQLEEAWRSLSTQTEIPPYVSVNQ